MKLVVTPQQMAEMDSFTIEQLKIPGIVLMENAGRGTAQIAENMLGRAAGANVAIFCGAGNNGGDGFVIARHLLNRGTFVRIYVLTAREKIKGDAKTNLDILDNMGCQVHYINDITDISESTPDLIVDAMLGTGVKGAPRGIYAEAVEFINTLNAPVLSVDIPTGVNGLTGAVEGLAIHAEVTATMALPKRGLLFSPGRDYVGRLEIIDIGMPQAVAAQRDSDVVLVEADDMHSPLPQRRLDIHKNRCGTVAVIAGSKGLTGAAVLSSNATLRAGAGLAYLVIPQSINAILETKLTEVITLPVDDAGLGALQDQCFDELYESIKDKDVVAMGPGLGQRQETVSLIRTLLEQLDKPMVLDADGLNACEGQADFVKNYKGDLVITPHPGELSRLTGRPVKDLIEDRVETVRETARSFNCTVVLKGGPTVVASPTGRVTINSTGNPGMATAGVGDVLTGIIAGFLAQGLPADEAAVAGVYIHGRAGDIARTHSGTVSLTAIDVLHNLSHALKQVMDE